MDSSILNNSAGPTFSGGGIKSSSGTLTVTNCEISGNSGGGGGIFADSETVTVSNSTINGNTSCVGGASR